MNYSSNIEYFRKLRGFTKDELYKRSGVSKSAYIYAFNNNSFTTKSLEKLAKALDVSVIDLVKDKGADENKAALDDMSEIKKKLDDFEEKHLK